jgi:predicted enzyme related to lactoylglutathione lyase
MLRRGWDVGRLTFAAATACEDEPMEVLSSRVLYGSRHFDSLRRFYEETVGLHVSREYGVGDDVRGVVFFLGGGFFEITRSATSSPSITMWLQVRDAAAEERRLRHAGVQVAKAVETMPWGLVESWVRDPEGNELRLVEVPDDHPLRRRLN